MTYIYLGLKFHYDLFSEKGGWVKVSRVPDDDLVPVEYVPALEANIRKDDQGREWLRVVDRHNNSVMPD